MVSPIEDPIIQNELATLEVLANEEKRYESLIALVGAAIAFGGGIWYTQGAIKAQEYFAGYLLEQSLSVDNLFVFVLVFGYFKTPPAAQSKALTYGIITAAVLRAVMIILGIDLIQSFRPVLVFFAGILIFTSYKLLTGVGDSDDDDLKDNMVVKFCQRWIKVSDDYDGSNFFTTTASGVREATPLLLVLAIIELSDVLFAVDSIPAVFGVTLDPFIVYTSNLFAIVSLRQLFGFVSTMMTELRFLDKAVATVLGFIGLKMLVGFADVEIPTGASLLFVGLVLGGGVAASVLLPEGPEAKHEE